MKLTFMSPWKLKVGSIISVTKDNEKIADAKVLICEEQEFLNQVELEVLDEEEAQKITQATEWVIVTG